MISWFLRQFATWMIFLVSLESDMSLSPTTNTNGVFLIFDEGQGHVPLPRVKVVIFLRDKYKSVKSMDVYCPRKKCAITLKWSSYLPYVQREVWC
jgi:hypothetical protein